MITILTEESYNGWLAEHPSCVVLGWMEIAPSVKV